MWNYLYRLSDYNHESNSIGAHTKLNRLDQPFVPDPSQINAYQFFNGAGNTLNVPDISSYTTTPGLSPINASQQQSNTAAETNNITQTMTFVSQGRHKYLIVFVVIAILYSMCTT